MKNYFKILVLPLIVIVFTSCSNNDDDDSTVMFKATINGASEVPASGSSATGTATLTYNATTKIFTLTATYSGITATAAHIHKGAVGSSGGVVFPLTAASPISYTSTALDASQEADLYANLYYINIHSQAFQAGEIRGQLIKQ
ncbi:CHRD domain-containing protein [Gaetbulibacter sp. M235]|uniref:CHRD domain-containing protein n=1 Tax=Gaetbulibacter sp. M235 TaxID=3126510 RepID=UPI00374E2E80